MLYFNKDQVIEVDVHGMGVYDAKHYLERFIITIDRNIKEIVVIHGYRSGDALLNMVRRDLKSRKIKQRIISLNPGITSLIINN